MFRQFLKFLKENLTIPDGGEMFGLPQVNLSQTCVLFIKIYVNQ